MDSDLLTLLLVILAAATGLNLFLILRIAGIVLPDPDPVEDLVPLVGQSLPAFVAERRGAGDSVTAEELSKGPAVLIFISPACPACRSKIAELVELLPAIEAAGVALWIAAADAHHDITAMTAGSPLAERTLSIDQATREMLNPSGAAPLYIFLDEAWAIRAGNYIGDENWQTFVAQMRETAPV